MPKPLADCLVMSARDIERFWAMVVVDEVSECWVWVGGRLPDPRQLGYGRFWLRGKERRPYRVAFETWRGPIPPGLELDHVVCDFPPCANPWHVEPATSRANILRGSCPGARNARKVACIRDHPLAGDNLYMTPDGRRQCATCLRAASLRNRMRRLA